MKTLEITYFKYTFWYKKQIEAMFNLSIDAFFERKDLIFSEKLLNICLS
jgi:hypothetical protein